MSKEEEESSSEEEEEEMETEEMKGRQIYGVKEYNCEFYFQIKIIKMWFDCQLDHSLSETIVCRS